MSDFRFELNNEGMKSLLKSQELMDVCRSFAEGIAERCQVDTEISEHVGTNRVNVSVGCSLEDTQNNELLKAMR